MAILLAPPAIAQGEPPPTIPASDAPKKGIVTRVVSTSVKVVKRTATATKNTVLHPLETTKKLPARAKEVFKKVDTKVLDTNDKFDRHVKLIGNVGTLAGTWFALRNFTKLVGKNKETVIVQ